MKSMTMAAGTTMTISQGANTVTVGSGGWTQAAGTFTGGSGTISVAGATSVTAGTFTATSTTTTFTGDVTLSNGVFTHNSGTVVFNGSAADQAVNLGTNVLNVVTVNTSAGKKVNLGSQLTAAGTLTINAGSTLACLNNAITTAGNVVNSGTVTIGGTGSWICNGATTFSGNLIPFQALTVNNGSSATLSVSESVAGATTVNGTLTVGGGATLTNTGTVTVSGTGTLSGTGTVSGAVATANLATISPAGAGIGTLTFSGVSPLTAAATTTLAIDILNNTADLLRFTAASGTVALGNIKLALTTTTPSGTLTILTYTSGSVTGAFSSITGMPAGYTVIYGATAVTIAPLVITARETEDNNHNGHIDRIKMTANVLLNHDFTGLTVTVAGYTVTGYTAGGTDDVFYVNVTELGGYDTGATPGVRITVNTSLKSASTLTLLPTDGAPVTPTDKALPVLVSATWTDGGTAGVVDAGDTVALTFSETVASASMVVGDLGLPVTSDTLDTTTISNQTGTNTITFNLAGAPKMNPGGTYSSGTLGAGSASGIYLASGTHLHDLAAAPNAGWPGSAVSAVDLVSVPPDAISIEWNDTHDTVAKTWGIGTVFLGSVNASPTYTVHNLGCLNVVLAASCSNSAAWQVNPTPQVDKFVMKADATIPLDGTYELILANGATTLPTNLVIGGIRDIKLQFTTPSTTANTTQQSISVTITAALP
jgi:hypothetical protein